LLPKNWKKQAVFDFLQLFFVKITIINAFNQNISMLDEGDSLLLEALQEDARASLKKIAKKTGLALSTLYSKQKRLEREGVILGYKAVLDSKKLGKGTVAFVLASFSPRVPGTRVLLSQKKIAEKISSFSEVQEVHIIAGDWDILAKVKGNGVEDIGKFVTERLRKVEGVEKTLTLVVFESVKEGLTVHV
jgi:DNA-binding Lrp family transcriptional regulator